MTLRRGLAVLGIVMIALGVLWAAQGAGLFRYPPSSFMIDQTQWVRNGLGLAVVGAVVLWTSRRGARR